MNDKILSIFAIATISSATLIVSAEEDSASKGKGRPNLKQLDKDGDGGISKEEAGERVWARLGKLDKNGDGKVAGAEFRPNGPPGQGKGTPGNGANANQPGDFLKRIDKNGDGNISKEEAPEQVWARMGKLDTNQDGVISREEMAKGAKARQGEFFAKADRNKDGKLTEAEAPKVWERISKADLNKDGAVSKEEMERASQYAASMRNKGGGMKSKGGSGAIFERYDEDKDGKISKQEAPEALWQKLSKADDNADGLVSREELTAVYAKRQAYNGESDAKGSQPKANGDQEVKTPKRPAFEE